LRISAAMSKYRVDDNLSESFDAAQSQAAQFGKPPPAWDAVRRARRLRRATGAALAVISALVVAAAALWTEGDRATAPTSNTHLAVDPGRAPSSQTRGHVITEPNASGEYEWRSVMHPGEQWEAVVRYHVIGARTWQYGLGSRRGRVQSFRLSATTGGAVTFLRGSLQPTEIRRDTLRWDLTNVVTTQRIALAFPPDIERREAYLQALSALPTSLILFLLGALAVGWRFRSKLCPRSLALGNGHSLRDASTRCRT